MKTRVIQNEPEDPTSRRPSSVPPRARPPSTEHAAPMGRWSPRRRKIAIWAAVAVVILAAAYLVTRPGSGTPAVNGTGADPQFAAIERFVQHEMAAQRIPGLALGIVKGDQIAYTRGFGEADESGRAVTPQTPFIICSVSKSFTALAIMQLVEAGKVDLDAPVRRYLPWFRVADERASAEITVRHLLNQTGGLSTKTGRMLEGIGDTSDRALEEAVRGLSTAELTAPVGEVFQYSNAGYWILGLIVQAISGQSYENYVQARILEPLQMRRSFMSEAAAQQQGLAKGYHYAFDRPMAVDVPYHRGTVPAGHVISTAEDMTHYLIAQLNDGRFRSASVLSPAGVRELHQPGVPPKMGTSYGMGWYVGPVNGIPAIYHSGEGFNFHANVVLVPGSRTGVVVLMNAENNLDLFVNDRMGTIADGVASLLDGSDPPPPPSSIVSFAVYAAVFGVIAVQLGGMIKSVVALRRGRVRGGRVGPRWRIGLSLALALAWAVLVLVLVPRKFGLPLSVIRYAFPDLAYILIGSAVVALGWSTVTTIWAYSALRKARRNGRPGNQGGIP